MTKSAKSTLMQLVTRLHEQALEMATLRMALDLQFKRIAQMQAELDLLPHARKRRQTLRILLSEGPPHTRWNGPERRKGQSPEELRAYLRELRLAWETRPEQMQEYDDRPAGDVEPTIENCAIIGRPDQGVRETTNGPARTVTAEKSLPSLPSPRGRALAASLPKERVAAGV